MKELNRLIQEGIVIKDSYSSKEEFLNSISDYLIKEGYVTPEFKQEILKRENEFPTGLITRSINVSIPHSETEYVLKESIIIAVPPEKIKFNRMDIPDEEIEVEAIFVLLLKEKERHITVLQQLAELLQWEELHKIKYCSSNEDIEQLLREVCKNA
jgi:PTS system galactitol-specific IIA component